MVFHFNPFWCVMYTNIAVKEPARRGQKSGRGDMGDGAWKVQNM